MQRLNSYRVALSASLLAMLLPIWLIRYLPLTDYPHAVARAYLCANYSAFQNFGRLYLPAPRLVPNMGFEAIAAFLGPSTDILLLGKILFSLAITFFVYGCHRLGIAVRGKNVWNSLLASFFIYSASLIYGSINTLLGLSLFLVAFAFWYGFHRAHPTVVTIFSVPILIILMLIHLSTFAFAILSMPCVLGLEIWSRKLSWGNATALISPLAAPGLFLIFIMRHGASVGTIEYAGFYAKALENFSLFTTYRHGLDALFMASLFILASVMLRWSQKTKFDPVLLALFVIFYSVVWMCPTRLFTSSGADIRFLLPAFIFLIISVDIELSQKTRKIVLSIFILLFATRIFLITLDWQAMSGGLSEQMVLMKHLPQYARVFPILVRADKNYPKTDLGIKNGHCYSVLLRQANDRALDAYPSQHAIAFREPSSYHTFDDDKEIDHQTLQTICSETDYLWCFKPHADLTQKIKSSMLCDFIDSADGVLLWRVRSPLQQQQ